jgi:hypothetical protein
MKPEDRLLLASTRQHLTERHKQMIMQLCEQHSIQWDLVYRTAVDHGVTPLVFANLKARPIQKLNIPMAVWNQFESYTYRNIALKSGIAAKLREVLSFFNQRNINVMLVKGAALDLLVYHQPWCVSHDVDLVIGARKERFTDGEVGAIQDLFAPLPGFEYDFYAHHDVVMNNVLPVDFDAIWQDAVPVECSGERAWVMCGEDMLLAACINACRKRFFRLKSLFDIAEIIQASPGLDWAWLAKRAQRFQCHNVVYTALLVTKMTLGGQVTDETLRNLGVHPLRAALVRHLLKRLIPRLSLAAAYPFDGPMLRGRTLSLPLLLSYASYSPAQVWRKGREINEAWRLNTAATS